MTPRPVGHLGLAFTGQPQFEGAVSSFLAEGAARGERLVLVADDPEPARWPRSLLDRGDLLILSTDDVYGSDRMVHAASQRVTFLATFQEAIDLGYRGLRVAADNTSLALGVERLEAWLRWETEADELMGTHAITGLCAFDRSRLDGTTFDTVMGIHAVTLPHLDATAWPRPRGR